MTTATRRTRSNVTAATRATSRLATLPLPAACAIAAVAGAIVLYAYGALAQALSVPMRAGDPGASHAQAVTPANFAAGVIFASAAGTIVTACASAVRPGRPAGQPRPARRRTAGRCPIV